MDIKKIKLLAENGFAFSSDFKIKELTGRFVGIDYNKENDIFGFFVKRHTYIYSAEDVIKIKKEIDEIFEIIKDLNSMN